MGFGGQTFQMDALAHNGFQPFAWINDGGVGTGIKIDPATLEVTQWTVSSIASDISAMDYDPSDGSFYVLDDATQTIATLEPAMSPAFLTTVDAYPASATSQSFNSVAVGDGILYMFTEYQFSGGPAGYFQYDLSAGDYLRDETGSEIFISTPFSVDGSFFFSIPVPEPNGAAFLMVWLAFVLRMKVDRGQSSR